MRGISLVAFALCLSGLPVAGEPETYFGFRLLDLQSQTVKWSSPRLGVAATVTYTFASEAIETPGARNCARMLPPESAYARSHISKAAFRREVAAAFRMWETAANITFRKVASPQAADILIGAQAEPVGRAFTNVELKSADGGGRKVLKRSLICLNPRQPWKIRFDGNLGVYDLRYTIAHEIGHAIGLDHPSAAGQLMSYRYDELQRALQPGDIRGAALLYGTRPGAPRFADSGLAIGSSETPRFGGAPGRSFGIGETGDKAAPARSP